MTIDIGMGVARGVPLFFDVNQDRFVPLGVVENSGASDAGVLLTQLTQPNSIGNTSFTTPSANDLNTASFAEATSRGGLMTIAVPYLFDPVQGTASFRRNSGGLAGSVALTHTDVQAQDVRSFLYGVDEDTNTQSVPILATNAGLLRVQSAPSIADTLTTTADFTTTAATTTQALAANTSRRFAIIQNVDATDSVRVGDSNTGAARGIVLAPGESVTFETTAAISVFPVANTPAVALVEIEDS